MHSQDIMHDLSSQENKLGYMTLIWLCTRLCKTTETVEPWRRRQIYNRDKYLWSHAVDPASCEWLPVVQYAQPQTHSTADILWWYPCTTSGEVIVTGIGCSVRWFSIRRIQHSNLLPEQRRWRLNTYWPDSCFQTWGLIPNSMKARVWCDMCSLQSCARRRKLPVYVTVTATCTMWSHTCELFTATRVWLHTVNWSTKYVHYHLDHHLCSSLMQDRVQDNSSITTKSIILPFRISYRMPMIKTLNGTTAIIDDYGIDGCNYLRIDLRLLLIIIIVIVIKVLHGAPSATAAQSASQTLHQHILMPYNYTVSKNPILKGSCEKDWLEMRFKNIREVQALTVAGKSFHTLRAAFRKARRRQWHSMWQTQSGGVERWSVAGGWAGRAGATRSGMKAPVRWGLWTSAAELYTGRGKTPAANAMSAEVQ